MKKAIFWIDDSTRVIEIFAKNIFPYFWKIDQEEGIETHVRILGNGTQKTSGLSQWEEADEQGLQKCINGIFEQLCRNMDSFGEKKIYAKKRHLVRDTVKIMYKKNEEGGGDEEYEEYRKLCSIWQRNPIMETKEGNREITEEAKECAKIVLEKMNITEGACVGLDLALLQKDFENVRDKKQPILSMELYHMIKAYYECFLYSFYVYDESFIELWKRVYTEYYSDDKEPIIHKRCDMYPKNGSDKLITDILNMIDKAYAKEKKKNVGKMEESD